MTPISKIIDNGRGLKPNRDANGVNGKHSVIIPMSRVAICRYLPGLLLKKGFLLLITSTIIDAEITDSTNHPVLNCSTIPGIRKNRTPMEHSG